MLTYMLMLMGVRDRGGRGQGMGVLGGVGVGIEALWQGQRRAWG